MKYISITFAGLLFACCAVQAAKVPGTNLEEKVFELNVIEKQAPSISFEQLQSEIGMLNRYIGSYPPRFSSEEERQSIYGKWLTLVSEAEAYKKANPNTEKAFYLLSELYRQGHNMDVKGSAEKALENLDFCLLSHEGSVPCNFSSSYFYLSLGSNYLDKAEKSLSVLRDHYKPKVNSEVEAGYVFLYLYRQNVPKAKQQIDFFVQKFPDSVRAKEFTKIKENLGKTIG